jgi:hypothetical protein
VTNPSGNHHQGKKEKYPSLLVQARYCRFPHVHAGQYAETGCCYYEVHPRSNLKKQIRRECLQLEGYYSFEFFKASITDLLTLLSSSIQNFEGGGDGGFSCADHLQEFKMVFGGYYWSPPCVIIF